MVTSLLGEKDIYGSIPCGGVLYKYLSNLFSICPDALLPGEHCSYDFSAYCGGRERRINVCSVTLVAIVDGCGVWG